MTIVPINNIVELVKELEEAKAESAKAIAAMSQARSVENAATNRLNAAQQAVDKWYAQQKAIAPWNTNWSHAIGVPVK